MDFCWLSEYNFEAIILGIIAVAFLGISAANTFFNDECMLSDRFSYVASWMWCICNTFWLISSTSFGEKPDLEGIKLGLIAAKIAFGIASVMILLYVIFSKIEKKQINFKRFKIK